MARFIIFSTLLVLASCIPSGGKEFANQVFEDIRIDRVLAYKRNHWGAYGCTYVVVRVADSPSEAPPNMRDPSRGYPVGDWQATPITSATDLGDLGICLTGRGSPEGLSKDADGIGVDGYGEEISQILLDPNAWFSIHGRGEDQVLHIYAPDVRLAVRLRVGD